MLDLERVAKAAAATAERQGGRGLACLSALSVCPFSDFGYPTGTMADSFEIDVTLLSDPGRVRSHNQDSVGVCEPADRAALSLSGRLYIVADGAGGVGGARAGELASRYAVLKVKDLYCASGKSDAPAAERLRTSMLAANDAIREHCRRRGRNIRMATTMVAAIIRGRELTIANVGDSRAYLMRDNVIQQITQDHSLVAGLLANGVITPEEAASHPQRNARQRHPADHAGS